MKKGWKIALISFLSLLGVVIITVAVALWLVLTPSRLTSIVNKLSDKYILCESDFDNVDLTIFKTFPYVGLEVEGLRIVNPMEGALSDTVATVGEFCVGFNLREFLKNNNVKVTKLVLDDVVANIYTNELGESNYDIFPSSEDTTSEPFEMPELVDLHSVKVRSLTASYIDLNSDIDVSVSGTSLSLKGKYEEERIDADLELDVEKGLFCFDTIQYVNEALVGRKGDLLRIEGHIEGDLKKNSYLFDGLEINLKDYDLKLAGNVILASDKVPMSVDVAFETGKWNIGSLLAMVPHQFTEWSKTMKLDAYAKMSGTCKGLLSETEYPLIEAKLLLYDGEFEDRTILPYHVSNIGADLVAELNLNDGGTSSVDVAMLSATVGNNKLEVKGNVADFLGAMIIDANIKGSVNLPDIRPYLPDEMKIKGLANLDLDVSTDLQKLQATDFKNMKISGNIGLNNIDFEYDTIYALIPKANVDVHLPSTLKKGFFDELLSVSISASSVNARMPNMGLSAMLGKTDIKASVSDIFDEKIPLCVACDFGFASLNGNYDSVYTTVIEPKGSFAMVPENLGGERTKYNVSFSSSSLSCEVNDSLSVDMAGLSVSGSANYDQSKGNVLQQWAPNFDVQFKRGYINLEQFDYLVQIPDIKFNYRPERCEIANANVVFGNSDFYLSGALTGLEKWISNEGMLSGDLYFTSNYSNVDDLLEALSGLGNDSDSIDTQRKEDNVDTSAKPFIVPKNIDVTLHTRIKDALAFGNEISEVSGDVQIRDGIAVLNQVGFVCKAARMQLTGMYKTPRLNHIFVGMDFHLLDINVQELIKMIPLVDSLVPMLSDLEGAADFHICAETYLNAFYKPKMSTFRAALSLTGQDLVVLNNKEIDRIAKLLQLKDWREDNTKIHLDSLDLAMTVFRREIEAYPFLLSFHKYQIVAEGQHNMNNSYDYHFEIVQSPLPVRLAVDVYGTMPNLKYSLSPKLRYRDLYRPAHRSDVDDYTLRIKALIRQSLEANVKEETYEYDGFDE